MDRVHRNRSKSLSHLVTKFMIIFMTVLYNLLTISNDCCTFGIFLTESDE